MKKETLELYPINDALLNDAIDRIVVKLHGEKKKNESTIFLTTGVSANCGTTTIAITIAIALAEAGWKTAFVDCDFRKDQKYKRIEQKEATSLSDFLSEDEYDYEKILHHTNFQILIMY